MFTTTIRHSHRISPIGPSGLNLTTERKDDSASANLRFDLHDSADPTAILLLHSRHGEEAQGDSIVLDAAQARALRDAIGAFLTQTGQSL